MTRIFGVHQQNTDIELQSAQLFHQLSASYKSSLQPAWFCHRESVSVSTQEVNVQLAAPALICSHSVVSCVPRASMHPWQQALRVEEKQHLPGTFILNWNLHNLSETREAHSQVKLLWQSKMLPTASHMSAGSSPGCSDFDTVPCLWHGKRSGAWVHTGDSGSSWFLPLLQPSREWTSRCRINQSL